MLSEIHETATVLLRSGAIDRQALYAPIIETLSSDWMAEHEIQDYVIDRTALQACRAGGGKWAVPDITLATFRRVIGDAEKHGVGVTTLADPADYKTWRVEVDARRANPDPADVDAFIHGRTGREFQNRMLSWCRRL